MQFEFPDSGPNKNHPPVTRTTDDLPFDTSNLGKNPEDLNQSDEYRTDPMTDDASDTESGDEMVAGNEFDDEINLKFDIIWLCRQVNQDHIAIIII